MKKDTLVTVLGALVLILIVVLVIASIVARFVAPCEYIDWMPTADVPARCLPGGAG